jgi:anti-sigma regulatory factor (Ser/Thr protein kinase)
MMDPNQATSMTETGRAYVFSAASAVAQAAGTLDAFCTAEAVPDDIAWRLRVALDEILANLLAHGTVDGRMPTITMSLTHDGAWIQIVVSDDAPPFDPLARPGPDVTLPLESRQPGGLGIAIVKSLMDEVRYERAACNIVTLRKRITPDEGPGAQGADADRPKHS